MVKKKRGDAFKMIFDVSIWGYFTLCFIHKENETKIQSKQNHKFCRQASVNYRLSSTGAKLAFPRLTVLKNPWFMAFLSSYTEQNFTNAAGWDVVDRLDKEYKLLVENNLET